MWRSDGSTAGTERVPAPIVGGVEHWRRTFAVLGGSVLLFTSSPSGFDLRLWTGDGSGTDWMELRDFGADSQLGEVVRRDGEVLFIVREGGGGGLRLVRTDGTAAGTAEVLDFAALDLGEVHSLAPAGGRLFFAAGPAASAAPVLAVRGSSQHARRLDVPRARPPGHTQAENAGGRRAGCECV